MPLINRGFRRRRGLDPELAERLPPGQHLVEDFPVLTVGPTPRPRLEDWTLRIEGAVDTPRLWSWDEFLALPSEHFETDIHASHRGRSSAPFRTACRSTLCWTGSRRALATYVLSATAAMTPAFHSPTSPPGKHGSRTPTTTSRCPLSTAIPPGCWCRISTLEERQVGQLILAEDDRLGFWEPHGYHRRGDPWPEEP